MCGVVCVCLGVVVWCCELVCPLVAMCVCLVFVVCVDACVVFECMCGRPWVLYL